MTSLRARLLSQLDTIERRRLTPDRGDQAPAHSPHPAQVPTLSALACWLCGEHMQPCSKADCPKVWRLKDAPTFPDEGGWKKEGRK